MMILPSHYSFMVATILLLSVKVNADLEITSCSPPFDDHVCDSTEHCFDIRGAPRKSPNCDDVGRNDSSYGKRLTNSRMLYRVYYMMVPRTQSVV
jgi:hypothetical protein